MSASKLQSKQKPTGMGTIDRRHFIKAGLAGSLLTTAGINPLQGATLPSPLPTIDMVKLGNTGMTISRLALGLGTNGWNRQSNQTRMGMEKFKTIAHAGYERGIRFLDTADTYGSHICVKEALKFMPREEIRIMTKIWTEKMDWLPLEPVSKILDRIRKEMDTDYIDIVMLHCLTDPKWTTAKKPFMDALDEAKVRGIVKKVGYSAHDFGALKAGIDHSWPDVILSRINHKGSHMDAEPHQVMEVLAQAHQNGKGIIGMKIFGAGNLVEEADRDASLRYVLGSGNIDTMTIGFESVEQVNDAVDRIMKLSKG